MVGEKYWKLVKRCPLKPLENESEYDQAREVFSELEDKEDVWSRDELAYFSVLSHLVRDYERLHLSQDLANPSEVLAGFIEDFGLSQADISDLLGVSRGRVSELVRGLRPLTSRHAMLLALRFDVSPSLFLPSIRERKITISGNEPEKRFEQIDKCIKEFHKEAQETKNVYLVRSGRSGILIESDDRLDALKKLSRDVFSDLAKDRMQGPTSHLSVIWYE